MKPIEEEIRYGLKHRLFSSDGFEKSSEKSKSLLNFLTKSYFDDTIKIPMVKNHGIIAKIYCNSKTMKYRLLKFNAVKGESNDILLEGIMFGKKPSKHIAFGKASNYLFIYDNEGTILVFCEHLKICELELIDCRLDPTLFVYEVEFNRIMLFVIGGRMGQGYNSMIALDTIVVFFLDFKDCSKFLNKKPVLYIRMKYSRMNPIVVIQKSNKFKMLIVIGGNTIKKTTISSFNEANLMCETIRIQKIKEMIFQAQGDNAIPIINMEDSLCLMVNGKENDLKNINTIRNYFGEAGILQLKARKTQKICFVWGIGKNKEEIWYIDMFDFVEHKAYIYQSQAKLKKNRGRVMCNAMLTKVGDDIYYLDDDDSTNYKKMSLAKVKNNEYSSFKNCEIF